MHRPDLVVFTGLVTYYSYNANIYYHYKCQKNVRVAYELFKSNAIGY